RPERSPAGSRAAWRSCVSASSRPADMHSLNEVTLVFTDVEGSTRLLRELGGGYADALAQHRRVLREVFGARSGIEVDTQGDAFFFAFDSGRGGAGEARRGADPCADGTAHRSARPHRGGLRRARRPPRRANRRRRPRWTGAALEGNPGAPRLRRPRPRRASGEGLRRARVDL